MTHKLPNPFLLPPLAGKIYREIWRWIAGKYESEMAFWESRYEIDHGDFKNDHFERIMLAMAEEPNDDFLSGKIVGDFGCGPRGSLNWAQSAAIRIGIDVLADEYAEKFTNSITSHGMIYLKSTEKVIPLPSGYLDVIFTLNAIDHVDNFPAMCTEIIRVLKPGGLFIGSFNLEEPRCTCEPQRLTPTDIDNNLLKNLEIITDRISHKGPITDQYAPFFSGELSYQIGSQGYLWVKARKPNGGAI